MDSVWSSWSALSFCDCPSKVVFGKCRVEKAVRNSNGIADTAQGQPVTLRVARLGNEWKV